MLKTMNKNLKNNSFYHILVAILTTLPVFQLEISALNAPVSRNAVKTISLSKEKVNNKKEKKYEEKERKKL